MKDTEEPKETGTNMRTRLIAVLVALAVFTTEASAMYHPGIGRFLQRDPGPGAAAHARVGSAGQRVRSRFIPRDPTGSNQYADGMNCYLYVGSNPVRWRDPSGLTVAERQMWQNMINEIQRWIDAGNPDVSYHRQTINWLRGLGCV